MSWRLAAGDKAIGEHAGEAPCAVLLLTELLKAAVTRLRPSCPQHRPHSPQPRSSMGHVPREDPAVVSDQALYVLILLALTQRACSAFC